jgi:hypothetical protein
VYDSSQAFDNIFVFFFPCSMLINQVISARKGEFETGYERGGQTREHVQLAKTLGVTKLLVVVNKMDDPTVNWSKERLELSLSLSAFTNLRGIVMRYLTGGVLLGMMKLSQRWFHF